MDCQNRGVGTDGVNSFSKGNPALPSKDTGFMSCRRSAWLCDRDTGIGTDTTADFSETPLETFFVYLEGLHDKKYHAV